MSRFPGRAVTISRPLLAPAVVTFGMTMSTQKEVDLLARELGFSYVAVRDLRAACVALDRDGPVVVVASVDGKPWDRQILDEKANARGVDVHWVAADDWHLVEAIVRPWLDGSRRRTRPSR